MNKLRDKLKKLDDEIIKTRTEYCNIVLKLKIVEKRLDDLLIKRYSNG